MEKYSILIFFLLLGYSDSYGQSYASVADELDQFIEKARVEWEVPGLAVAIVKDGKTLLSKGYGEQEIGSGKAVNSQTIFVNASTTKAMTAFAMALLVDQGKVDWDDKVVEHLPEFQLADPYATNELRVRDLFTHSAGLGNADFLWVNNDLNQEEILYQMRYLEPSYPFRGGYTYQNIMYLAAGKLLEKVSGVSWDQFIKENIFQPLGMNRSFPYLRIAKKQENRSSPHQEINGEVQAIQDTDADAIGPAGSVWSCVEDMAKWMTFLLDGAKIGDKVFLKPSTFKELFEPQIIIPYERFYPSKQLTKPHWTTYAMGWFQHDYQGRFVSFHTGSLAGRVAILGLVPDEKLGVFVYGNLGGAELRHAIMYKTFDLFGAKDPNIDWSKALKEIYDKSDQDYDKRQNELLAKRVEGTKPSKSLEEYTGDYSDIYYGAVEVILKEDQLHLKWSSKTELKLEHWHYDIFRGHYAKAWYSPDFIQFKMNTKGEINQLQIGNEIYTKK